MKHFLKRLLVFVPIILLIQYHTTVVMVYWLLGLDDKLSNKRQEGILGTLGDWAEK